jgi:uncharacterized YccA/Bax inhibitor family protein
MSNPILTRALDRAAGQPMGAAGVEIPGIAPQRMTMDGTVSRAIALFAILAVTAAITWTLNLVALAFPAMFVGLGLALWASFSKKVRPGVIMAYAAVEGVFLAGLTLLFESAYPGIAAQAVTATMVTAGVVFIAYRRQVIRVTPRFRQIMMFALMGYLGFALINLGFAFFSGGSGVYSSSFGWLIALLGVGLAAFTLVMDFANIEEGIGMGLPADEEWRAAFGLMVSLIWMYTEILRLLAILRGDD